MTDKTKTMWPPIFDLEGIKIKWMNECIDCINQFVHSEIILINKSITNVKKINSNICFKDRHKRCYLKNNL